MSEPEQRFELVLVGAVLAAILAATGTLVVPKLVLAREAETRTDATTIAGAASAFLLEHPGRGCPSIPELRAEGHLGPRVRTRDAWDTAFRLSCGEEGPRALSAGPDQRFGTDDDL